MQYNKASDRFNQYFHDKFPNCPKDSYGMNYELTKDVFNRYLNTLTEVILDKELNNE